MTSIITHPQTAQRLVSTLCCLGISFATQAALPPPIELAITGKYLLVPMQKNPPKEYRGNSIRVEVDSMVVYQFGVLLASTEATADAWGAIDVSEYIGKKAQISLVAGPLDTWTGASKLIASSNEIKSHVPIYTEKGRPQFHFSQRVGWNNDVNGMVYSDGLYHLSWQCNPMITPFANMFWGHAVSKDLIHWKELPIALRTCGKGRGGKALPNTHPAMVFGQAFSGSACVDHNNTLGKQVGTTKTLIACVTDTAGGLGGDKGKCGESLAYSTDNGKTYTLLRDYNPIISHEGRDPKIFWHPASPKGYAETGEQSQRWCVVVYDGGHEVKEPKGWIGKMVFYSSKDLKTWTKESETEEIYHECPEFVQLPVDPPSSKVYGAASGAKIEKKWMLFDATPKYQLGTFDGKAFKPDFAGTRQCIGGEVKAAQCFSDAPDGRAIAMVWARTPQKEKGTPFNQGFTLPLELSLKTAADGIRCYANPVEELKALRGDELLSVSKQHVTEGEVALKFKTPAELVEICLILDYSSGKKPEMIELQLNECTISYQISRKELSIPKGKLISYDKEDGKLDLRIYVDRPIVEVFAEHGAVYMLHNRVVQGASLERAILRLKGGDATLENMKVYQLKSIWK
ncbi:MAG: glycoside hydrolase family 32 protein [bacterium]